MKHSLTWRDHTRFALASSQRRRETLRNTVLIAGLIVAYGIVGTVDYAVEKSQEADTLRADVHAMTRTLADCLNGTATFTHSGPHDDGFGTTAVRCRRAEEFKL